MNHKPKSAKEQLILSLDVATVEEAKSIVKETKDVVGVFKLGMQLQFAGGFEFAEELVKDGKKVFLDVKLLDIENTIINAIENLKIMGVNFVTIHAYPKTMKAVAHNLGESNICLLGVTVLTSMNDEDLKDAGYNISVKELVNCRFRAAKEAGMGGIVCSAKEVKSLQKINDSDMIFVTPGIRPIGSSFDDQKRVETPFQAIKNGSDYIVVGRPITRADDKKGEAEKIVEEIEKARKQLYMESKSVNRITKNNIFENKFKKLEEAA